MSTEDDAAVVTEFETVADGATPKDPSEGADDENTDKGDIINDVVDQPKDTDIAKGAPQAAPASPGGGNNNNNEEDEFEDCKISPLDAIHQQRSLKSALLNTTEPEPTTTTATTEDNAEEETNQHQQTSSSSLLHQDEFSQSLKQPHHPNDHESALSGDDTKKKKGSIFGLTGPPFRISSSKNKPTTSRKLDDKQNKGHSHPRKSAYRTTNISKLRGQTNTPPDSADFWKQSSKFKHMVLTSIGDFLTGAFADDEETSASYFSRELMEQLSDNDPTVTGIWLQSKNLYDGDIKVLCDSLMRNTTVTEVWLPGNFITDVGANSIAHMLKFNKSIKELFLGQNDIGPKGAAALAAALARGNSTLVALGLGENRVGVEGAGAFAAALRHNHVLRTLDLKKNGIPKSSSIRALLSKMLEFNASDPGDESLVLGLQEELVGLIQNLPEDVANEVVVKAEDALKTAMVCRRRGDIVGAAEAEGLFIRICTTGETPIDPPTEEAAGREEGGVARKASRKAKKSSTPSEPDRLGEINEELSELQFVDGSKEAGGTEENHFNDEEDDVKEEVGKDDVEAEGDKKEETAEEE